MPRGEETQEAPQEERQEASEIQESEARRDAEVVAEPEAVVERERPVEESEAIEAAVVEAVEAAEAAETAADGGRTTEDREGAAEAATEDRKGTAEASTEDGGRRTEETGEDSAQKLPEEEVRNQPGSGGGEVAATPINLPNVAGEMENSPEDPPPPPDRTADVSEGAADRGSATGERIEEVRSSDEVAATPITLPKEDPDGVPDPSGEVSATPITLPKEDPDGVPDAAGEISATPITLPKEDPDGVPDARGEVSATPITLPKEDPDGVPDSRGEVSATPITLPKEDPDGIPDPSGEVSATPITLPKEDPDGIPGSDNEVSATPITLPGQSREGGEDPDLKMPVEEVRNQPGSGGGEVAATPINLPREADIIENDPDRIPEAAEPAIDQDPDPPPEMEAKPVQADGEADHQDHWSAEGEEISVLPVPVPGPETEGEPIQDLEPLEGKPNPAEEPLDEEGGSILISEEVEELTAEMEELSPEELADPETTLEKAEDIQETGPDWYIYEDSEGNKIVVDADGNPIKSPPVLYQYQGKTYAAYPGDKPAVDEQGNLKDPSQLVEFPNYQAGVDGMYLHENSDGSVTVVDKYGNPIPSQPSVITYQGKKYIGYPGQDLGIDEQGNPTDINKLKAHEASYFQQSTEGLQLHDDGNGNLTVVDETGKEVASPPAIVTYQGKNYLVYPGQDLGIDEQGNPTDLNKLKAHEASYYQQPTDGMQLHDDGNGNLTVVDETGKKVDSPPGIITYQGKNYLVYPGQDAGVDDQGQVTDPKKLQAHEASYFKQSTDGMSIHDDGKGNLTVVDRDGKPVDSQPAIVTYQGKQYLVYPGQDTGVDATGKVTDPKALQAHEANYYQKPTENMFLHDDGKGNYTVVDGDGQPVDSPPIIVEKDGKIYATYPGWDDGIDDQGQITDPNKLQKLEISFYKPPWWKKKGL